MVRSSSPPVQPNKRKPKNEYVTLKSLSLEFYDTNDSLVDTANGAPNDLANLNPIFRSIAVFSLLILDGKVPTLNIEKMTNGSLEIWWPASFSGWSLQSSTADSPSLFQARETESVDGKNSLTIKTSLASELFRLVN